MSCAQAEACPGCDQIDGVEQTSTTPRVTAWKCTRCGMSWAISLVNPHLRDRAGDYAEQVGAARWILGQVVQLVDDMPKLTDMELRDRLTALADRATSGSHPANGLSSPDPSSPPRATAFSVLGDKPK